MDWIETLKDVNYLAVIAGVVATFAVGMTWYSESLFGKKWMELSGLSKKDVEDKDSMMHAMVHSAIAGFITVSVVAALMLATGTEGALDGAVFGAVIGFGIAMSSMVSHDVFSRRPTLLTRINGAQDVVKYALIGLILGVWM